MDSKADCQEGDVGTSQHSSRKQPEGNNDGHQNKSHVQSTQLDTLGVSVFHLEHFFLEKEVCASNHASTGKFLSKESKVYDIEDLRGPPGVIRSKSANTVCPVDKKMGAAYVHCLEGDDHVGEATHMLSYSWDYAIGDIVDTLTDFCLRNNLNPKRTYIWICCLCVNQHRVVQSSTQQKSGMIAPAKVDFFAIFGERVKKIGHLLAMMAPWKAPIYTTRVWCIFEIFTAHTTDGCEVDIVMPPKEKQSLEQDVLDNEGGINALYETLGNTKVENAKASVKSDRLAILTKVKSDVGYSVLNHRVNDLLRGWMHGVLTQLVETRENTNDEDYVAFCNKVGSILLANGEHNAAMKLHQTALEICDTVLGKNRIETADSYDSLGSVLHAMGDYQGALAKYEEALAIRLSVLVKNHLSVAGSNNNIGSVLQEMGDYEGALAKYEKALAIKLSALGKNHPLAATTHNNIGSVLYKMGDYEGALAKYEEALAIRLSALGKNHPDVATTHIFIGAVLSKMGDYEGALAKYEEALAIQLSALGKNHPDVAVSYNNIGSVLQEMGDFDGALTKYEEALAIILSAHGKNHPLESAAYYNIGGVMYRMGDYSGALLKFEGCLAIREPVLGADHPYTKTCKEWIEVVKSKMQQPLILWFVCQLCCFIVL
ncbi:Kinesin light chain [Seminavis robusta]|uniref:Kinesin light chain n=1 Tax=Seminavis robusta TaxID=568900 RepID=A0A9N8EWS2_9STRA|nr:Kinesin light chain [Seminavis robusta]|eukprot:Sro2555_g331120.1 Kinesin light chain (656) ;mRNA; r:2995-4962